MNPTALRTSPLQDELERLRPAWSALDGMPIALDFGDRAGERAAAKSLGLADVSAPAKLAVKGPGAEAFLQGQGIELPAEIFQVGTLAEGGLVARTGVSEFFLQDGVRPALVLRLDGMLDSEVGGAYRVVREDASILLCGSRAIEVLLQTCAYDFRKPGDRLVMTRVAGVSCSILHRNVGDISAFQLWLDGSFGAYLWQTLLKIVRELGGGPVGLASLYPELVGAS